MAALTAAAAVAIAVAGCGATSSSRQATPSTPLYTHLATPPVPAGHGPVGPLRARRLAGIGTALVDGNGRPLYAFMPDRAAKVRCVGACQSVWPPLVAAPGGARPVAVTGSVRSSLVGSDPNPDGRLVVTYAGWPLYAFGGDATPGVAQGEGVNLDGGRWYVLSPSGRILRAGPR